MATNPRTKVGTMPCEGQRCESHTMGRAVTVYRSNKSGTLGYHCDVCDRSPYAKQGSGQYAEWMGDIVPIPSKDAPPVEVAAVAVAVDEATAGGAAGAAVKLRKSGFSLGGV